MGQAQNTIVVGAGPVGSLAALYAAHRGHRVDIYELRGDPRDAATTPLNFTKSINLALSERGLNAMRHAGQPKLLDQVVATTIPMRGRMIHGRRPDGALYAAPQDYDARGLQSILAIDRGRLNETLLDMLEAMPNVAFFFHHKLTGADFCGKKAWFEVQRAPDADDDDDDDDDGAAAEHRAREIEVDFDFMIGADGAHSAVRFHLMKFVRMDYQQEYIDTLWCEFRIQRRTEGDDDDTNDGDTDARFRISPNHLHIWPGRDFMFIAIPSEDGSFTCTLFAPGATYEHLEGHVDALPGFFDQHFPGVTGLIPTAELKDQFCRNPHLPLISIKCKPYHFSSAAVIVGDAAHAMVPFYGQGMNAGLEDVRVLFAQLDAHPGSREAALAAYTAGRVPDAHAINDLALQNYTEMRASVLSPAYRLRKYLEETLSVRAPCLGWQTRYARVAFGNEGYAAVVARTEHQGRMLLGGFVAAVGAPVLLGGLWLGSRYGRALGAGIRALFLGCFSTA